MIAGAGGLVGTIAWGILRGIFSSLDVFHFIFTLIAFGVVSCLVQSLFFYRQEKQKHILFKKKIEDLPSNEYQLLLEQVKDRRPIPGGSAVRGYYKKFVQWGLLRDITDKNLGSMEFDVPAVVEKMVLERAVKEEAKKAEEHLSTRLDLLHKRDPVLYHVVSSSFTAFLEVIKKTRSY